MTLLRGTAVLLLMTAVFVAAEALPSSEAALSAPAPAAVDYGPWDRLLKRHVDEDGRVAYARLAADGRDELERYLEALARANPAAMSQQDQLAFWINAYNAGIVAAVLEGYLPETMLSRVRMFRWYRFPVAGKGRTPEEIEHEILREQFREPRIHFALVCGATSCPKLRREAYRGERLAVQLDAQARDFINDPSKNRIDAAAGRVELSSIFRWFASDFAAVAGSVGQFVAGYAATPEQAELLRQSSDRVEYFEYEWALNAQPGERPSEAGMLPAEDRSQRECAGTMRAVGRARQHGRACRIS